MLSEFAGRMVELLADVAQHPAFPASELPRLKGNLAWNLAVALSQPQQVALQKFREVLYKEHPYGRVFPTEGMIKGYTLEQVRGFYDSTYGAARSHLYIVGRFDAAAVEEAVKKAFAGWPRGAAPAVAPPKPASIRAVHIVDRPGAVQSTIVVGVPTIDPSHSELSVRYRDAYWAENADVTTTVTGASLKEIFAEIDRLQSTPPPAEELAGIQNYLAGTFVLQNSSRAGISSQLAFMDLHALPPTYASTYVKQVYAVTPQQVVELAKQYLQDERATIVIVGDRKAIEEQVKGFGALSR